MQVGIGMPNTVAGTRPDELLKWSQLADAGPFSTMAVLDRIVYDSYEPIVTLSAAAAVTKRINLASMIVISPLRRTGLLAKAALSVNALCDGRFTLGVAVGARQEDYNAAGVSHRGRGQRFTQQLAEIRQHWENESIGPRGENGDSPKLLVGGLSDITFGRVARYADGYMHNGGPPRIFERMADKARTAWSDSGRPETPELWGMGYFAFGDEAVQEAGADYLRHYYDFTGPFAERIAQGLLTTPQAVHQFVRGYDEAGCDQLILFPTSSDPAQVERLAEAIS